MPNPRRIEPLADSHLQGVADLFMRVFRHSEHPAPPSLRDVFADLYLRNPWADGSVDSYVCLSKEDRIIGFIGGLPRKMLYKGKPVRMVVAGNHMVHPDVRDVFVAGALLNRLLKGDQDFTYSDSANSASRRLWESLGGRTAHLWSLRWLRILRPMLYGLQLFTKKIQTSRDRRPPPHPLRLLAYPVDAVAGRVFAPKGAQGRADVTLRHLIPAELADLARRFHSSRDLSPDYSVEDIEWLFSRLAQKEPYGNVISLIVEVKGKVVGWFVYKGEAGGTAQVVHLGSTPRDLPLVLAHLLADATRRGCHSIEGMIDPVSMHEFTGARCLFFARSTSAVVFGRNHEVLDSVLQGNAYLSRLEGEWWTRLQGDRFV